MWNLECDFPAVLGWIQATQSLCAHQNKGMITAQVERLLKGIASHEQTMRNTPLNSLSGIFMGQGLRGRVEKGDESILVDFGIVLGSHYLR